MRPIAAVVALFAAAPAIAADRMPGHPPVITDLSSVDVQLADWPESSRKAARKMVEKYGAPQEATSSLLLWRQTGPWKRTIVYKEEVAHDFPMPHVDVIQQYIDFRVPVEKFDELARFDGSVIADRTKGEISARCNSEEGNILAINLAKEILDGKRSVDGARTAMHEAVMKLTAGTPPAIAQTFQFNVARGGTADRDKSVMGEMKKVRGEEKGKEEEKEHHRR